MKTNKRTSVTLMMQHTTKDLINEYANELDMDNASFMREAINLYMNMLDGKLELTFVERPHNFFADLRPKGNPNMINGTFHQKK